MNSKDAYIKTELGAKAQRAARQMYRKHLGGWEFEATCTFINYKNSNFIVQCHHSAYTNGRFNENYVLIDEDFFCIDTPFATNEKLDIAISHASLEMLDKVSTINFIEIFKDIKLSNYSSIYAAGFPATRQENIHKTKITSPKTGGVHPILGSKMQTTGKYFGMWSHLSHDKTTELPSVVRFEIPVAKGQKIPKPYGMSGGPIFEVQGYEDPYTAQLGQLLGIMHEVDPIKKRITGTSTPAIAATIDAAL